MKKIDWRVATAAIICITTVEVVALLKEMDGVLFGLALVAIAGIAGFKLKK